MATLFLFVLFQIPINTAPNMLAVLAMHFMTGFFGSPTLATSGASMANIFPGPQSQLVYVLRIWALGAVTFIVTSSLTAGPTLLHLPEIPHHTTLRARRRHPYYIT
ncbi:hypothetical protein B0H14DRAFT_3447989 [Mycena olivaceomarginata]|nr:hypothetical protein B0H14DRAFT_3447989 [Mycena olivaceomarginata]